MFKVSGLFSQVIKLATEAEKQKQADTSSQVDSFAEVDPSRAFSFDQMNSLKSTITDTLNTFPSSNFNPQLTGLQTELSSATPEKMSQILSFSNVDPEGFKASEFPLDIESLSGLGGATKGLNNNLAGGNAAVKTALNSSQSLSDFSADTLDIESIGKSVITNIQGAESAVKALAAESAAPLSGIAGSMSGSLADNPSQFSGGDIESFLKQLGSKASSDVKGLSKNIESITSSIAPGFSGLGSLKSITEQSGNDLADTAKAKADGLGNQINSLDKKTGTNPNNNTGLLSWLVEKTDAINAYGNSVNKKIKEANTAGVAKNAAQNNPEATPTILESVVKNVVGNMNKQDDAKFKGKVLTSENSIKKAAPILKDLQTVDAQNESSSLAAGRQHADKSALLTLAKSYNDANRIYTIEDVGQLFYNEGMRGFSRHQFGLYLKWGLEIINKMPIPNMRRLTFESLKANVKMIQREESRVFWYGLFYRPVLLSPYMDKQYYLTRKAAFNSGNSSIPITIDYGGSWAHYGCKFYFAVTEFNLKAWQHAPNSNGAIKRVRDVAINIPIRKSDSDNTKHPKLKLLEDLYPLFKEAVDEAGGLDGYLKLNPGTPILIPPETYLAYKGYAVNAAVAQKLESYGFRSGRIDEGSPYWLEPKVLQGVDPLQYVNKNGTLNYDAVNELLGRAFI